MAIVRQTRFGAWVALAEAAAPLGLTRLESWLVVMRQVPRVRGR